MFRQWNRLVLRSAGRSGGMGKTPPTGVLLALRLEPKSRADEMRHIIGSFHPDEDRPTRLMLKNADGGNAMEASRYTKRYSIYWTKIPNFDGMMPETY